MPRKRLKKVEVDFLGLKPKYEKYEKGKRNPRYTISKEQNKKLKDFRLRKEGGKSAKILIFDIETAPSKAYIWSKWKQNIHDGQLINDWFMLTWSAKWLFKDEVLNAKLTTKEAIAQNDYRITKSIWELLDKADILIGHNIKKFDIKKLNTRFLLHGLGSPSSFLTIDTLVHARKSFSLHSNKLDYIAQSLGVGKKVDHSGFDMWAKCMEGDKDALHKMSEYNNGDILINEQVYLKIRPFIHPHPNLTLFMDTVDLVCPSCESNELNYISTYHTYANSYDEFRCACCGNRSRTNKRQTKVTPLPR
jgi:hypothetical protein